MGVYIAVDLGGTHMRAAAYPQSGLTPLKKEKTHTQDDRAPLPDRLAALIQAVCPPGEAIHAIGVAIPGPLNPKSGVVYSMPNIAGLRNYPLAEALRSRLGAPVYLDNDANLAALGEWQHGAGRGHDDMVYITVSTGIGGGVISEGRLLHGARGLGAEIGHITVLPKGPVCSCGQRGHLEAVAAGPAIVRWVEDQIRRGVPSALAPSPALTAAEVADAARRGDALARQAFRRAGEFLAQGIADLLHIFNPSAVVIGGGVAQSADLFLPTIQTMLPRLVMDAHFTHELVLTTARLGDNAGLTGALALARQHA